VPTKLYTVPVNLLHYSECASKAVNCSFHHTALHSVCQQGSLEFLSTYCNTVCVPANLSTIPVNKLRYIVCASKAIYSSCHHTALQCVCRQVCLQFLSPYCITLCVPARLSTVPVNILHYSVCVSKALYSSCHHTALHCVCQHGCQQFQSTYCITVCASKAVYSSCHHTALQWVCQQGSLHFLSPYCITVCVPARLSTVHVTILHYSVCASKAL